jgi:hypothetical protein
MIRNNDASSNLHFSSSSSSFSACDGDYDDDTSYSADVTHPNVRYILE